MTNKDMNKIPGSRLKLPANNKKKATRAMAKLKSSSWYESAAQSIRITNRKDPSKLDGNRFDEAENGPAPTPRR